MNSTKALQVLHRKMTQASREEREAYNYLIEYVASKHKDVIIGNQLFGKLYIYLYGQFIKHYETTLFDPIPKKELHRILDRPLKTIVEEFVDIVNMGELYEDSSKNVATWKYEQIAENLRVMVNKALEEFKN
jgi:hypothetical protein